MAVSLTVTLTAADVLNPATPSDRTVLDLAIANSTGRLRVQNQEGIARSVHHFTVADATDVGYQGTWKLDKDQAATVLALSCSLANPRALFSTLQPDRVPAPIVEHHAQEPVLEVVETPEGICLTQDRPLSLRLEVHALTVLISHKLELDEGQVLDVASSLLSLRPFDKASRSLRDSNILDAIEAYRRAADCSDAVSCFQSLYMALEKAVKADIMKPAPEPTGCAFDAVAGGLTGMPQAGLKDARLLNDRLKHISRKPKDASELDALKNRLPQLTSDLKRAVDAALQKRI